MTITNFEQLMERWEDVLEAYGTPKDFANNTTTYLLENSENKLDIPLRVVVAPGYAKRRELMEKQRKEADERKAQNLSPRWINDGCSCFLCDNIGQAYDIGNNLMLPFDTYENYVLIPNRYPAFKGHLLLCAKEHNKQNKQPGFPSQYFETAIEIAETYDLDFLRNHPHAGMSIPRHEHFQFQPKFLTTISDQKIHFSGISECELIPTEYGEDIFSVDRTRFDTLAFKGKKSIENMLVTTKKLEENDEIFTFYYGGGNENYKKGTFFLTPHLKKEPNNKIGTGQPLYLHISTPDEKITYKDFIEPLSEFIYQKETFQWDKYF